MRQKGSEQDEKDEEDGQNGHTLSNLISTVIAYLSSYTKRGFEKVVQEMLCALDLSLIQTTIFYPWFCLEEEATFVFNVFDLLQKQTSGKGKYSGKENTITSIGPLNHNGHLDRMNICSIDNILGPGSYPAGDPSRQAQPH